MIGLGHGDDVIDDDGMMVITNYCSSKIYSLSMVKSKVRVHILS
jgi:hypothetical protein